MAEARPSAGIARNCTQYGHQPVLHAIARTTAISRYCTQSDAIRSSAGIARNRTQYGHQPVSHAIGRNTVISDNQPVLHAIGRNTVISDNQPVLHAIGRNTVISDNQPVLHAIGRNISDNQPVLHAIQPVNYVNRECCAKADRANYSRSGLTALSQVRRAVSWVWAKGAPLILRRRHGAGDVRRTAPARNSRSALRVFTAPFPCDHLFTSLR
jgi:hypothetical protein